MRDNLNPLLLHRISFVLCLLLAAGISFAFHDKFWWGPDEGFYSYISQRILDGDVVHKDIQALHPGLLFYLNTLFLKFAGGDPVGLRYPLILITIIQAGLAYRLCQRFGVLTAVAASVSMIGFSFIQFVNPTPNWYHVTLALCLAYILDRADPKSTRTIVLIGALVGIGFLMRQLTGVFLAIGVTTILFLMHSSPQEPNRKRAGTMVLGLLGIALSLFVLKSANMAGLILFGIYPPLIVFWAAKKTNIDTQVVGSIVTKLMAGALLAALPMIVYHLSTGSFAGWINNSLVAPFRFNQLTHLDVASYGVLVYLPIKALLSGDFSALGGLIFWTSLLLINLALFITVVRKLRDVQSPLPAVGILILFHSLVALFYEYHVYLTYTTGLILVGLLFTVSATKIRQLIAIGAILLSLNAILVPAGRPLDRGLTNIALNKKTSWTPTRLTTTGIFTDKNRAKYYNDIIRTIHLCSTPEDTIYAAPVNPAIYFLADRQPPFLFINSALGLTSDEDVDANVKIVRSSGQPALIINKEDDKYTTSYANDLLNQIAPLYKIIGNIGDLTFYHRLGHDSAEACTETQTSHK